MVKWLGILNKLVKDSDQHQAEKLTSDKDIVLCHEDLYAEYELTAFFNELNSITNLPESHFKTLYIQPFMAFTHRFQKLPYYEKQDELFINHIKRKILSGMRLRESKIMPLGISPELIHQKKDVWRFITFYFLLIDKLHEQVQHFEIYLDNEKWQPLRKLDNNKEFKFTLLDPDKISSSPNTLSLMYSTLFFSPASLGWIYEEENSFTEIHNGLTRKKKCQLSDIICRIESSKDSKTIIQDEDTELTQPTNKTSYGVDFLGFLATVPDVYIYENTLLFQAPQVFIEFSKQLGLGSNWKPVKNSFNRLKVHIKSGTNDTHSLIKDGRLTDFISLPIEQVNKDYSYLLFIYCIANKVKVMGNDCISQDEFIFAKKGTKYFLNIEGAINYFSLPYCANVVNNDLYKNFKDITGHQITFKNKQINVIECSQDFLDRICPTIAPETTCD